MLSDNTVLSVRWWMKLFSSLRSRVGLHPPVFLGGGEGSTSSRTPFPLLPVEESSCGFLERRGEGKELEMAFSSCLSAVILVPIDQEWESRSPKGGGKTKKPKCLCRSRGTVGAWLSKFPLKFQFQRWQWLGSERWLIWAPFLYALFNTCMS